MAYKLLGIVVWKGGRWFLRRKYGAAVPPKGVIAGAAVAVALGLAFVLRGRAASRG